jgi:glycolate oxidase
VLEGILPSDRVLTGDQIGEEFSHDEALTGPVGKPACVAFPVSTDEVAALLRWASAARVPVTARGSGTGLSGAANPVDGALVVSFERMNRVLEIDTANQVAVVEPGVTLAQLDAALAPAGLLYPVYPGEYSASLGGNVATNAGGMRAIKYGVTRHQVLGVTAVLASGEVVRTGGRFVKGSSGYDLTQLIIGSEGTLALVTEAVLRLYPRQPEQATVMAPFRSLREVTEVVPRVVARVPLICEYIDSLTLASMVRASDLELGLPEDVVAAAAAHLVVVVEGSSAARVEEDVAALAELLSAAGAIDVYVLPAGAATKLIEAREKAFWLAKAAGADDIVDVVVPRAAIAPFMDAVTSLAGASGSFVAGCGHVGDGNVHLSVFQKDPAKRSALITALFEAGLALGGAISGEHGIGTAKRGYFVALEDPVKLALLRRIKSAFDPDGILNPETIF